MRENRGIMKSNISGKAKRLTGFMALTAAVCVGALAVAVVLFFEVWWTGLIALAVSMLSGVATVLLFMAYQADRRRNMRRTEEEEEDARIMALLEMSRSQSGTDTDGGQGAAKDDKRGEAETKTEAETGSTDNNASSGNSENISEAGEERHHENEDEGGRPSTLEMRPPLKLLTVEEARSHTKGDEKERDDNAQDDKNEG